MEDKLKTDVRQCLTLQLSELEMLQSIYCNPGELVVESEEDLSVIRGIITSDEFESKLAYRIGYVVYLERGEVTVRLPHDYPKVHPDVFLRLHVGTRTVQREICEELHAFVTSLELNELCVATIVQWITDRLLDVSGDTDSCVQPAAAATDEKQQLCRMWIYSHHIYSKIKRKDILAISAELDLTGFSMPGKPGVIVVEGLQRDVEDFWGRLRRMQWRKLTLIETETSPSDSEIQAFRKFGKFEEKHFEPRQAKGRNAHMDLGALYEYLQEHGCGDVFQLYFGVNGKVDLSTT